MSVCVAPAWTSPVEAMRLGGQVTLDAADGPFGADRVGLHLAPRGDAHDMGDSDLSATFHYVAHAMRERGLAFLMARERLGDDRIGHQ